MNSLSGTNKTENKESLWGPNPYEKGTFMHTFTTSRNLKIGIYAYILLSAVIGVAFWTLYNGGALYNPAYGIARSPEREFHRVVSAALLYPPVTLWAVWYHYQHASWTAPRGKYVKGRGYPLFSAYNIVAIAMLIAFSNVLGQVLSGGGVDLGLVSFSFGASFFGAWAGGTGIGVGNFFRSLLFGQQAGLGMFSAGLWDIGTCSVGAAVAWRILEPARAKGMQNPLWKVYLAGASIGMVHWIGCITITNGLNYYPMAMAPAWYAGVVIRYLPQEFISCPVAAIVSDIVVRSIEGRARRDTLATTRRTTK